MMKFPFENKLTSEDDTIAVAKEFANEIKPGDVILLNGNLGAGKTFFVKALLNNFGVENTNSPTFAIVNEYNGNDVKFYHFDFYRINKEYELYDIGIEDYLADDSAITLIEWADLFPDVIYNPAYKVEIKILNDGSREIFIAKM